MPLNQRMHKENVVYLHNWVLYSVKNNDILNLAGKWMELENIILSEVKMQKDNYHIYSLIGGFLNIKQRKTAYKPQSLRTCTTMRTQRETYIDLIYMESKKHKISWVNWNMGTLAEG